MDKKFEHVIGNIKLLKVPFGTSWTGVILVDDEKKILTDACKIMVLKGEKVYLVEGEIGNMKITYPYDLKVAEALLKGE